MNSGIHEALVDEVVGVFRKVAASNTFPDAAHADLTSIGDATHTAWEHVCGQDELTWSDIRSREMRSVWDAAYASPVFKVIEPSLQELIGELSEELRKHFLGSRLEGIGEDVIADMQHTVYARAVSGTDNSFFENVIRAYKRGAWPCGWQGGYPDGHLITFAAAPSFK